MTMPDRDINLGRIEPLQHVNSLTNLNDSVERRKEKKEQNRKRHEKQEQLKTIDEKLEEELEIEEEQNDSKDMNHIDFRA